MAFNSFDMTPDQGAVAAGYLNLADQPDEPIDQAMLIINVLTPGRQPPPITISPGGQPLSYIEGVAWSADGTRLAALVSDDTADHLVVIDRGGRYEGVVTTKRGELSCGWQVGVSADGSRVRCGDGWLDLAGGDPVDGPGDDTTAPGEQLGGYIVIADGGTVARVGGDDVTLEPGGPVAVPTGGETVRMAFSPDLASLFLLEQLPVAPAWRQPVRRRAQGRVTWIAVASRTVTTSVTFRDSPADVDPDLDDGWIAVLTRQGDVLLLQPS